MNDYNKTEFSCLNAIDECRAILAESNYQVWVLHRYRQSNLLSQQQYADSNKTVSKLANA